MRAALESLLQLQETPHRTALAFGVGVFIAFSPFLGIHTPIAIIVAFAFGLNRVAVLTGAWINFWALVPCYMFGTFIGRGILGVHSQRLGASFWSHSESLVRTALASAFVGDWHQANLSMQSVLRAFGPLFWPFIVGNLLLGLAVGLVAYRMALRFLERRAATGGVPADPAKGAASPEA